MLRRLDMPLSLVAEVVSAVGTQDPEVAMLRRPKMSPPQESKTVSNARGAEQMATYWETVERRIASQRELAAHLRNRLQGREGSFDMYEILERDVPEQIVLTEQRHVQADELPRWIGAAMTRLMKSAGTLGGPAGYPFVVYHGEVNQDSDGPVEVCVPVYFTDFGSAAPTDEVCDVVFPVRSA
jgi:hypothetical protein